MDHANFLFLVACKELRQYALFLLVTLAPFYLFSQSPGSLYPREVYDHAEFLRLAQLEPLRGNYDVTFYELSLEPSFEKKLLAGNVKVTATALADITSIEINLVKLFTIDQISWVEDGSELEFTHDARAVVIQIPPIKQGKVFTIEIVYHGRPPVAVYPPWEGGFIWTKRAGTHDISVACEGQGASIWWPLKDHLSDEPDSVRMHVTVDSSLFVVGNGTLENIRAEADQITYTWFTSYPINNYNITFYAGNYQKISVPYEGIDGQTMMLDYYVLPRHKERARVHFEQVPEILRIFEELFGPYPWYRDGFKLVESSYAGMEHQTAIAYGSDFVNDSQGGKMDYILVHEIAHEWWGNSVSASSMADIWLHEGFATYAEGLYLEKKYDREDLDAFIVDQFYDADTPHTPVVTGIFGRHFIGSRFNVYPLGAIILHTFRLHLGNDSLFFQILQDFQHNYYGKAISSNDFILSIRETTGKDYSWFFSQYLLSTEPPILSYEINGNELTYRWENVDLEFNSLSVTIKRGRHFYTLTPAFFDQTMEIKGIGSLMKADLKYFKLKRRL